MTEPREVRCDCGNTFTATNPRARFCSSKCRTRASREGRVRGNVRAVTRGGLQPIGVVPLAPAAELGHVADAARAELEAAGRQDTALGRSALALAARIDTGLDTGSALASAVRGLTETIAAALKGAEPASSLDELKARRRAKRGA